MTRINFVFILITAAALYFLGFVLFKKTQNITASVIIQFTPFFSGNIYEHLADISSESLLIFAVLIFLAISVLITFDTDPGKKSLRYVILFSLICGFGIACKITFFPLMIIPLILIKRISNKILLIALTVFFFLVFIFPAISAEHSGKYFNWIKGIITSSGKYGTGKDAVINTQDFFQNFKTIFTFDLMFSLTYFLIAAAVIFRRQAKHGISPNYIKLLTGILLSMTVYVLIVAKHFDVRYMIPAQMLCVTGLVTTVFCFGNFKKRFFAYLGVLMTIVLIFQAKNIVNEFSYYSNRQSESKKISAYIQNNFKNIPLINANIINSKEYCLYFGTDWAGSRRQIYIEQLEKMYPDYFYFDRYVKNFYLTDTNYLKEKLKSSDTFLFQCDDKPVLSDFISRLREFTGNENFTYKEIFSNGNGEALYEFKLNELN